MGAPIQRVGGVEPWSGQDATLIMDYRAQRAEHCLEVADILKGRRLLKETLYCFLEGGIYCLSVGRRSGAVAPVCISAEQTCESSIKG